MTDDEPRRRARQIVERPYLKVIHGEREEGYLGEAPEFPGCLTAGETEMEALANLDAAMTAWVMTALDDGDSVPEPSCGQRSSACLVVRVPASLSETLAERAQAEGITASQLALRLIAQSLSSVPS